MNRIRHRALDESDFSRHDLASKRMKADVSRWWGEYRRLATGPGQVRARGALMVLRFAEVAGALAIIAVGFTAVGALTYEWDDRSLSERGPVLHSGLGVGTALEDGYTAHLALAQFPLPVAEREQAQARTQLLQAVQHELAKRGFDVGPADGVLHPETRSAIRDYEATAGLDVTGEPTANLLRHIRLTRGLADAVLAEEQLNKRELVARVQRRLTEFGYDPGASDGAVTVETREAIAAFEGDRGLSVTGELSPRLVQELGSDKIYSPF
jgi:hypothetical protein